MSAERIATVRSGEVDLAAYEWRGAATAADTGASTGTDAGTSSDVPVVLLVHGWPDTHAVWGPLAERLADHCRVLAYDVRGAGASGAPTARKGYRLDQLVEDQLNVLEALAPGRKVHLVAHDWGSIQSWYTVTDERARDHIASYTSVSGPCLDHAAYWMRSAVRSRSPRRWAQVLGQAVRSWYVVVFQVPVVAPLAWRFAFSKVLARALTATERAEPAGRPEPTGRAGPRQGGTDPDDHWPAATMVEDGARGIQLYRANFAPRLLRPEERHADLPVQLIVPTRDRYMTPALYQDMDRWVSRLRRHDIPAGHWMVRTESQQLAGWVRELVEEIAQDHPVEAVEQAEDGRGLGSAGEETS